VHNTRDDFRMPVKGEINVQVYRLLSNVARCCWCKQWNSLVTSRQLNPWSCCRWGKIKKDQKRPGLWQNKFWTGDQDKIMDAPQKSRELVATWFATKSLSAERTARLLRSNTSNYGTDFILSFCHATYLHSQLFKMLMQFWRHATK